VTQRALTNSRPRREGLIRARKESERVRNIHQLETVGRGNCQDKERERPSGGHSHPGDRRDRNLSGYRKKVRERGHLLPGDRRWRDLSGHREKPTKRGALTNWRPQMDLSGQEKKTERVSGTHFLKIAEGETYQSTKRKRPSEKHSLPGDRRWRDLSGHGEKVAEGGALTL
jgi:hypothetical protein